MRKHHETWVMSDDGVRECLETGVDPLRWHCDFCGTPNERNPADDWPTCVYCGRFRDDDVEIVYGWGD